MSVNFGAVNYYPQAQAQFQPQPPKEDELSLTSSVKGLPSSLACMGIFSGGIYSVSNVKNMKIWGSDRQGFFKNFLTGGQERYDLIGEENMKSFTSHYEARIKFPLVEQIKRSELTSLERDTFVSRIKAAEAGEGLTAIEEEAVAAMKAAEKEPGFWGKIGKTMKAPFKKLLESEGYQKFSKSTFGKFLKRGGAPMFAALEGVLALFTEIIPAFKQKGLAGGIVQTFKSTVNAAASVVGFIGGEALGAPAGAIVGASIGAFAGPLGASIGLTIGGFLGGMTGGILAGDQCKRIARCFVGENVVKESDEGSCSDGVGPIGLGADPLERELLNRYFKEQAVLSGKTNTAPSDQQA